MARRKAGEGPKDQQDGVVAVAEQEAPYDDDGVRYYSLRFWSESLVTATECSPEASVVDEVFGSVIFHDERSPRQRERAGRFRAFRVRLDDAEDGDSSFEIMDGHSQALADVWFALFDPKTEELRESIGFDFDVISRDLLYLDTIEILPAHRGKGLGLAVACRLIDMLAGLASLVAICPSPLQFCPEYGDHVHRDPNFLAAMRMDDLPKDRLQSLRRLRAYWSRLGFTRVGRSMIYILSTSHHRPKLHEICDTNLL